MTEKRFENRLDKSNVKFNTLNPVWDNEKETGLNVFEMIDELNKLSDENEVLKSVNMEYEDALGRLEEENKQQKRFLKIHDDYYLQYGDDKELFDLHKPADIRSLCIILNREHGFSELQCEYNDKEYGE